MTFITLIPKIIYFLPKKSDSKALGLYGTNAIQKSLNLQLFFYPTLSSVVQTLSSETHFERLICLL